MEGDLKYIQTFEVAQKKESSIFKAVWKQQWTIWHQVYGCTEALDKPIMINDLDNKEIFE